MVGPSSIDRPDLAGVRSQTSLIFMLASGVTLGIWLMEPVSATIEGRNPKGLDTYTTLFTGAFDIGVIVPAALIAGVMILRGSSSATCWGSHCWFSRQC